jgi:lipopolysaccharide export LptBFGC system permease protein LptF
MMRRIVDASLPIGCLAAIVPAATGQQQLPVSLEATLGTFWGHAWAATLAIAMLLVVVGICLRRPRPGIAYMLELPSCIFAGIITTIYGSAIWLKFGTSSWIAIWFVYAIAIHFLARFAEMTYARQVVAKREK